MGRRIACIALPDVRLEIARESEPQPVLAVIVAHAGGAVQTDRDVLGNTRIDVVSHEAGAFGVRPGQTVAAARAKCAALRVRVVPNATVQTTLARVAEAMLAFGPTTAFDVARDVVWVDVGGCAHLHGGEIELARALGAAVRSLGHACRVAVADGPRVASAVARFSTRPNVASSIPEEPVVVPEGKGAFAVRSLPIAALALDDDVSAWMEDLGLSTCGDLQKLPRKALGMRLGERVHDVMQLLDGRDLAPLEAWRPPEVPEERVELEWGAHSTESLAFVLKILCDRLAARLHGRALAAARLELVLTLDRALLPSPSVRAGPLPAETETCPHRSVLSMILPSPIVRAADLLSIVRVRLDGCSLPAPVLAVTLRAPELARAPGRTLDLLSPGPKAHRALPRLVAELVPRRAHAAHAAEEHIPVFGCLGRALDCEVFSRHVGARALPTYPCCARCACGAHRRAAHRAYRGRRMVATPVAAPRSIGCMDRRGARMAGARGPPRGLSVASRLDRLRQSATEDDSFDMAFSCGILMNPCVRLVSRNERPAGRFSSSKMTPTSARRSTGCSRWRAFA
jgi:protein ImuB